MYAILYGVWHESEFRVKPDMTVVRLARNELDVASHDVPKKRGLGKCCLQKNIPSP